MAGIGREESGGLRADRRGDLLLRAFAGEQAEKAPLERRLDGDVGDLHAELSRRRLRTKRTESVTLPALSGQPLGAIATVVAKVPVLPETDIWVA